MSYLCEASDCINSWQKDINSYLNIDPIRVYSFTLCLNFEDKNFNKTLRKSLLRRHPLSKCISFKYNAIHFIETKNIKTCNAFFHKSLLIN
jgi:hypothetical protein